MHLPFFLGIDVIVSLYFFFSKIILYIGYFQHATHGISGFYALENCFKHINLKKFILSTI